jgi:nitrite reductase/ring-hydroxylating ferredoxin subunit
MLIWDTEDPYHYVRLQRAEDGDSEILIVGGEDHKTGQANDAEERWRRLESWTRERFPMCGEVAYRWSGQVMEPVDYMGFIGRNPGDDNVYIVTGDSGQGMTHGTLAGRLITDLILGRLNAWSELYDPGRISIRTAPEYLRENLNVAEQYTDWIKRGDASSADEIAPGTGALLRQDRKIIAAYRDDEGVLHELSAVCTHLKCIVQWNAAEKSWDCPCHGSRFGVDGHVLNGPAVAGLERIESEVKTE